MTDEKKLPLTLSDLMVQRARTAAAPAPEVPPALPPAPPPVENPATRVPEPETRTAAPDSQTSGYPETRTPELPNTRVPDEAYWPSRATRTQATVRLPKDKLKRYKRWCFDNEMDFQDLVEMAVDAYLFGRPGTQASGYPNFQPPKLPDTRVPRHDMEHDDSDDDYLRHDNHHHRRVVKKYESLTGKTWRKFDERDYPRVIDLPIEDVEALMQIVADRAPEPIGTFRYLASGIEHELKHGPQGKAVLKKRYRAVAQQIRSTHTGRPLPPSEFAHKLKTALLDEGLPWFDDLGNEVM